MQLFRAQVTDGLPPFEAHRQYSLVFQDWYTPCITACLCGYRTIALPDLYSKEWLKVLLGRTVASLIQAKISWHLDVG